MTDPAQPSDEPPAELVFDEPPTEAPAEPNFPTDVARTSPGTAPVGYGIGEALLWIVGFFVVEIACEFVGGTVATLYRLAVHGAPVPLEQLESEVAALLPWIIGFAKCVEVVATVLAIRLRFGRQAFRATGFPRSVPLSHAVILMFAVLPATLLSGQCFALLHIYWDRLTDGISFLESLDKMSSIESVQKMVESTHWAVLVFVIAVLPALNEEFLFRAAIGRGLFGRYGFVAGVTLTSMLFAAVHISPVHAAALLPLAVLLHVGYLSSGSVWWPVLLHFFNNSMAVAGMELARLAPDLGDASAAVTDSKFLPAWFLGSSACVAATVWLLWKVRVRWVLPDGTEWHPPFPTIEPPRDAGATRVVRFPGTTPLAVTAVCYLLFPVALAIGIAMNRP